jgi:putative sigma-54 modulation protein
VTLHSGVGRTVTHGEERAESVNAAVDKVAEIMTRQLERRKGRIYDKGRGRSMARGTLKETEPAREDRKVVKTKHFVIPPMTLQEAINEMERLGHSFFLFVDAKTEVAQLLYRRNDGNYGLIEPEFQSK